MCAERMAITHSTVSKETAELEKYIILPKNKWNVIDEAIRRLGNKKW